MGRAVDRRAAAVDPDVAGLRAARAGASRPTACRGAASVMPATRTTATAWAEIAAAGAFHPGQVAGRGLHVHGAAGDPEQPGDRVAHRRRGGRPAAAGRRRSSGRPRWAPAGRPRGGATTSARSVALAMPRGVGASAGKRRPRSPSAGRAEQRVGDGVERHVAVRVAVQARRRRRSRRHRGRAARPARRDGCRHRARSGARPRAPREPRRPAERARGRPCEVLGHGHLEVRRFAGDRMDGDSSGLEQGGLIGELARRRPAGTSPTPPEQAGAGSPWGVWAVASAGPVDRLDDDARRRSA